MVFVDTMLVEVQQSRQQMAARLVACGGGELESAMEQSAGALEGVL